MIIIYASVSMVRLNKSNYNKFLHYRNRFGVISLAVVKKFGQQVIVLDLQTEDLSIGP